MKVIKPARKNMNRDFTFLLSGKDVAELKTGAILEGDAYVENLIIGPGYIPYVREGDKIRLSVVWNAVSLSWSAKAFSYENDFCINPKVRDAIEEKGIVRGIRYDDGQGSKLEFVNYDAGINWDIYEAERVWGTRIANIVSGLQLLNY